MVPNHTRWHFWCFYKKGPNIIDCHLHRLVCLDTKVCNILTVSLETDTSRSNPFKRGVRIFISHSQCPYYDKTRDIHSNIAFSWGSLPGQSTDLDHDNIFAQLRFQSKYIDPKKNDFSAQNASFTKKTPSCQNGQKVARNAVKRLNRKKTYYSTKIAKNLAKTLPEHKTFYKTIDCKVVPYSRSGVAQGNFRQRLLYLTK